MRPHVESMTVATRVGPLHVQTMGSGPPAVLWHSLFVDSTTWCRVQDRMADARRLIVIDGPNHGGNRPADRAFTLHDCVGIAEDVLGQVGVDEPVDWVGNAWGGHVGILFAAAHPDRCRSLLAIGTPVHAPNRGDWWRTALLATLYRAGGPKPVTNILVDALLGPLARKDDPSGAAIVADAFARADRRGMFAAIRWLSLRRPDLTPVLDRIRTPTLLTTGSHDPMWTVENASAAAGHLPRGALVILPAAGHIGPLLQAPAAVVDLVLGFWGDPEATIAGHLGSAAAQQRRS
jgi:pimeloyl-ACP methyl ester carboxylesterase